MTAVHCGTGKLCGIYLNASFFLLLFISALLGAGLRTLTNYQKNKEVKLNELDVSVDLAVAMLIAFALALIYLIGGISITGSVVVLEAGTEGKNFATVATSLSLIGLASGYLVPLEFLAGRLKTYFSEDKENKTKKETK
jgi:hypothetical protein